MNTLNFVWSGAKAILAVFASTIPYEGITTLGPAQTGTYASGGLEVRRKRLPKAETLPQVQFCGIARLF